MNSSNNDHRTRVELGYIGAGRGAREMQPRVAELNRRSETLRLDQLLIDPVPGKARALALRGEARGLSTSYLEATGEEFLVGRPPDRRAPMVIAIDDARSIARCLQSEASHDLFGYVVVALPDYGITGWRFLVGGEDREQRRQLAELFTQLATVTARGGTREVFGRGGRSSSRLAEGLYRGWFSRHLERNLSKVVHGLEPETASAEVTFDGRTTSQLVILERKPEPRTRGELLRDLESSLLEPTRPGTNFALAELTRDGIGLHRARLRAVDGRFALTRTRRIATEPVGQEAPKSMSALSRLNAALLAD